MTSIPHDPEDLRRLASDIAKEIFSGDAADLRLDELLAARRKCPSGRLCCFNGYTCHFVFYCVPRFRCSGGFTGSTLAAQP